MRDRGGRMTVSRGSNLSEHVWYASKRSATPKPLSHQTFVARYSLRINDFLRQRPPSGLRIMSGNHLSFQRWTAGGWLRAVSLFGPLLGRMITSNPVVHRSIEHNEHYPTLVDQGRTSSVAASPHMGEPGEKECPRRSMVRLRQGVRPLGQGWTLRRL